jgi:hypothetical protein
VKINIDYSSDTLKTIESILEINEGELSEDEWLKKKVYSMARNQL